MTRLRSSARPIRLAMLISSFFPAAACASASSAEPHLTNPIQLTSRDVFIKAGEAYFDHHSPPRWIIFQATPVPAQGEDPAASYSMYLAKLRYEGTEIVGIEEPVQLSSPASANTCGWFHPTDPTRVLYGSTLHAPTHNNQPGYQRGTGRYKWEFPREMRIVEQVPHQLWRELSQLAPAADGSTPGVCGNTFMPHTLAGDGDGYVAEGSLSSDGATLLYTKMVDPDTRDLDIFVKDIRSGEERCIIKAPGYDGGPFFSPDGRFVCYRSDRNGDSLLQLFIAELSRGASGKVIGVERERQLTSNEHVNWAPYWHPSGKYLVYASSQMGHRNYEVFAIEADIERPTDQLVPVRITDAPGADVLPVFSDDGGWMMWTCQRGPLAREGGGGGVEERPSSQLWIARFAGNPFSPAAETARPTPEQLTK